MKQVLLLVAVYSLIINQISKESPKAKDSSTPTSQVAPAPAPKPALQSRLQPFHMVAPHFTYGTLQFIRALSPSGITKHYFTGKP